MRLGGIASKLQKHITNSPKSLLLSPKEFRITGYAFVLGRWEEIQDFYVEKLDDSFLNCGVKAFLDEKATKANLVVYRQYKSIRWKTKVEILVDELMLTLEPNDC